jgi:predicted naringenin-chalcone synthase
MSFAILGLGTAVPASVIDQDDALRIALALCARSTEQASWLPAMYAQTGITTRHSVLGRDVIDDVISGTRHTESVWLPRGGADDNGPTTGQRLAVYAAEARPLAVQAARQALDRANLAPGAITHLVTVSCTGFYAPGLDQALIRGLALAPTVQRTHVGYMGCHGALNGLRVAQAFTGADPRARVLLCSVELCSLHYHYGWDPPQVIANALFADGAAALVGTTADSAPADRWRAAACGSCLLPDSADAMTWTVGDHGFVMTLSKRVPILIASHLRPWLTDWLGQHGVALAEVASWAIHPGGPRILSAVEEALCLPAEATRASREVLAANGNMSSATILFILHHLIAQRAPRPCVALGFGPGLVAEAALFR